MREWLVLRAENGADPPPIMKAAPVVGEPGRGESQDEEVEALGETSKHRDKPTAPGLQTEVAPAGIAKVIPPRDQLAEAYRLFARSKRVKEVVEEAIAALAGAEIGVPDDLGEQIRAYLAEHPDEPWEHPVRHAAADFDVESEK